MPDGRLRPRDCRQIALRPPGQTRDDRRREHCVVDDEVLHQAIMSSAGATTQVAETVRQGVRVLGGESKVDLGM